eukprot:SM000182S03930  [mRNA]  locus=s182:153109:154713:+ [translate_table: standard]
MEAARRDAAGAEQLIARGVQACPFLRNIAEPTAFTFNSFGAAAWTAMDGVRGLGKGLAQQRRGPIFEDGPSFDAAFRLFHGRDGIVPLTGSRRVANGAPMEPLPATAAPLRAHSIATACPAAAISLSAFGPAGPFSFDSFMDSQRSRPPANGSDGNGDFVDKRSKAEPQPEPDAKPSGKLHEALGEDWLASGNCPLARSYRAAANILPLVAGMLKPPPGVKYKCPPAIVAARAALARTTAVRSLRPQPLPKRILAIGMLGFAINVPLGMIREHTTKFSPQWFLAVHAAVPLVVMLRKAVLLPKRAMAFTIASAILGQAIGARLERLRLHTSVEADGTMSGARTGQAAAARRDKKPLLASAPICGTSPHRCWRRRCHNQCFVLLRDKGLHAPYTT